MTAQEFFIFKGVVGVIGTLLLLLHMNQSWTTFDKDSYGIVTGVGQRMRFLCLFGGAVLVTGASIEQLESAVEINKRNVGALVFIVFLVLTAVVSIIEARRMQERRH